MKQATTLEEPTVVPARETAPDVLDYVLVTPARNDGTTVYRLRVKDVPVDGFWSISVYDAAGYFAKNERDAYSLNDRTAQREPDGSVVESRPVVIDVVTGADVLAPMPAPPG